MAELVWLSMRITYLDVPNMRKGEVPSNACAVAQHAEMAAASERRMVSALAASLGGGDYWGC